VTSTTNLAAAPMLTANAVMAIARGAYLSDLAADRNIVHANLSADVGHVHEALETNVTEEIRKGIKALYRTGDIVEVRAFHPAGFCSVGRYPVGWDLVKAIEKADKEGNDVYVLLNPTSLPPIPLASGQSGTKEGDVLRRRHYLLDFDPIREHKIATDAQHAAALKQATLAREDMAARGWGGIVTASSGNGVHLLVPIDLPNDEASKEIVRLAQRGIARKFNTPAVECECFPDAARITRAYGTLNKKSKETPELKWRRSGILRTEEAQ
jgi:hypothetical protein